VARSIQLVITTATNTTTILRPFVRVYPGELVPEETVTHSHKYYHYFNSHFAGQPLLANILS